MVIGSYSGIQVYSQQFVESGDLGMHLQVQSVIAMDLAPLIIRGYKWFPWLLQMHGGQLKLMQLE